MMNLQQKLSITGIALLALVTVIPVVGAQTTISNAPATCTATTQTVATFPTTFSTQPTTYLCKMSATSAGGNLPKTSWGTDVYKVTSTTTVSVTVTDTSAAAFIGNYYTLWYTSDATLKTGWTLVGGTPEVVSGSNLKATAQEPSYWTGTGTTHSAQTFKNLALTSGTTYYFRVDNSLFKLMGNKLDSPCSITTKALVTSGCQVSSSIFVGPNWSGAAQYSITFATP